jgi:sialic acid synthase SpsE
MIYIADPGTNYFGNISLLKTIAYDCKLAGVSIFKPQIYDASLLYPKENNEYYSLQQKCSLNIEQVQEIYEYCNNIKLKCIFSVFDLGHLRWLSELDIDTIKISSSMAGNKEFLDEISNQGFNAIISMSPDKPHLSVWEYKNLFKHCDFMYCRMRYPSLITDYNLEQIRVLEGISDHTSDIHLSIASTAIGANMIEKHIYADYCMLDTPDYSSSIPISKLEEMIVICDQIEKIRAKQ